MWTHATCTWGHIFVAWGHMYRESYGHMQNCMRTHTFEVRFRVEQIHKNFSSRDVVFVQALRETVVTPIVIQNVGEVTVHSCRSGGFRLHRIRSQITQCVYCVVVRYTPQKCQIWMCTLCSWWLHCGSITRFTSAVRFPVKYVARL